MEILDGICGDTHSEERYVSDMKMFLRAALILPFLVCVASAVQGTYIYKGASSVYDPFTGKTHSQPLYIFVGDSVSQGGSSTTLSLR